MELLGEFGLIEVVIQSIFGIDQHPIAKCNHRLIKVGQPIKVALTDSWKNNPVDGSHYLEE
jgi:hypothetical protein